MCPTDLTEEQWAVLKRHVVKPLPEVQRKGQSPKQDFRAEINGMPYASQDGLPVADAAETFHRENPCVDGYAALTSRWRLGCRHARATRGRSAEDRAKRRAVGRHHQFALDQECWERGQRGFDAGKKTKRRK